MTDFERYISEGREAEVPSYELRETIAGQERALARLSYSDDERISRLYCIAELQKRLIAEQDKKIIEINPISPEQAREKRWLAARDFISTEWDNAKKAGAPQSDLAKYKTAWQIAETLRLTAKVIPQLSAHFCKGVEMTIEAHAEKIRNTLAAANAATERLQGLDKLLTENEDGKIRIGSDCLHKLAARFNRETALSQSLSALAQAQIMALESNGMLPHAANLVSPAKGAAK